MLYLYHIIVTLFTIDFSLVCYNGKYLINNLRMLSMEPWGLRSKKFQTSVAVPPAPVWVPSQRPLAPSLASVTSVANDKGDDDPGG